MGEVRENVRKNLGYYLSLRKLSQKDLADKLNVSQSAVTNWIKGKNSPDIETVSQICEILNISVVDLFGSDGDSQSIGSKKNTSEPEKSESEGNDNRYSLEEICMKMHSVFMDAGILKPGQDLTNIQTEILISFIKLMDASMEDTR